MTPGKSSKCRLPSNPLHKTTGLTPNKHPMYQLAKAWQWRLHGMGNAYIQTGERVKERYSDYYYPGMGKKWGSRERNFNFGFSCMELPLPSVSLRSFGEWVRKSPIDPLLFGHVRGLHGFYLQYPFFLGVILGVLVKFQDISAIWRMI